MTKETGTLEGLKVQPGDVVEFSHPHDGKIRYTVAFKGGQIVSVETGEQLGDASPWTIISRAKTATPSHIVTLPCGKTFDLTNPYATPYGLLDEIYGAGAADALMVDGREYQWFDGTNWSVVDTMWLPQRAYRVKPAPVVETITRDGWASYEGITVSRPWGNDDVAVTVTFTRTRTNGVIDNDSYKVKVRK